MRAVRIALAAGAVAGLVVLAACTDNGDKSLTDPKTPTAPRLATASSGTFANAKHIDLCVSASSPAGNYTFVNSAEVNDNPKNAALQGNGFRFAGVWKDAGDGGTGTTVYNDNGGAPPNVAKGAGYTVTAGGTCVRVLDRTNANVNYDPNSLNEQDRSDSYAGVTVTYVSNPMAATYDHTDCLLDVGVLIPQRTISPLPALYDPTVGYAAGNLVSTNAGNRVWRALTAYGPSAILPTEGANWTNAAVSGDCGGGNNPTRAFANFEHGTVLTFFFNPALILADCVLGYPYTSSVARTSTIFNESEVLTGFTIVNGQLHMWYSDEHALTLGVDSVFIKNDTPPPHEYFGIFNFPAEYALEKMLGNENGPLTSGVNKAPGTLLVGRTTTLANPAGIASPLDARGRPLYPALFLTDILGKPDNLAHNDPVHRGGDWQYGVGTPIKPNAVYGTWKGATVVVNNTKNPAVETITPGKNPPKNHKVVGAGGIAPPAATQDFGFTSDVVWDISTLGLIPGHPYRAQFMVHDGDQNKSGGDTGQACVIIQ